MISIDSPSVATGGYVGLLAYVAGSLTALDRTDLLIGCGLLGIAVAIAVGERPALWAALGRRRLLAVPMAVPWGTLIALVIEGELVGVFDTSFSTLLALVALSLLGVPIWLFGTRTYVDRTAGELRAYWTAEPDPSRRRQIHWWSLGVGLGVIAALVGTFYAAPSHFLNVGVIGVVVFVNLQLTVRRPREYEAFERGLKYTEVGTVDTRYHLWDRFEGLHETDKAVVLERRWWLDKRMRADQVPPEAYEAIRAGIDDSNGLTDADGTDSGSPSEQRY